MRKLFIRAALFTTVLSGLGALNSCRDAVDIIEPGVITDDVVFTNVTNLNAYLVGSVYGTMEPSYAMYLSAVITDELKPGKGSGGQEFQLHRFFIDNSDTYTGYIWNQNYLVINRANRLLAAAAKITPAESEVAKYNSIIAQARAIRAFSYLQLETYFSPDMKDANGLGVILLDHVPAVDEKLPRSTNQAIYDFINADLDFAKKNLAVGTDRFYADKNFVNAVGARLNLYRGNYTLAKQYAQEVISTSGLTLTPATPIKPSGSTAAIGSAEWNTAFYGVASSFNPYRNIWNDSQRGEVIFSLNRLATGVGLPMGAYFNTNESSVTGNPMWVWGRNLFNIFNSTDGDIRRYAYVDPTAEIDANYATSTAPVSKDQLVIDKYPGKTSTATRNDLKLFRLSEMYFILAECAVESGDLAGAADYIQAVRGARNYKGTATTPAYANATAAYADILKERRVELALEGHRYIDLKRLAAKAGVTMDRNPTDDAVAVSNLPNNSYKYTLPIPLSEISANPGLQQNPGY